ncbi:hypothetical protein ACJW31_12G122400 [Castanea mollissima]
MSEFQGFLLSRNCKGELGISEIRKESKANETSASYWYGPVSRRSFLSKRPSWKRSLRYPLRRGPRRSLLVWTHFTTSVVDHSLLRKPDDWIACRQFVSEMDSLKNKQAAKNRQEEIRKAAHLRAQGGGSSALPPHVSTKRKYTSDL